MLRGYNCGKIGNLSGPCEETLLKQRRASAYYKNNPDKILAPQYTTFTNTPLGGPLDYSIPGYEDAPGTDFRIPDIDMCAFKKELEDVEHPVFDDDKPTVFQSSESDYQEPEESVVNVKENFINPFKFNPASIIKTIIFWLAIIIVVIIALVFFLK